ncbi:MAG: hypothetical protein HKM06_07690 [Spirochaetales bacterium]|nr:hypothetical protein [Spirochaetales bacterium]
MTLILTEKPDVASKFAAYYKAKRATGYFETKDVFITYSFGHLFELLDPNDYLSSWKKWSIQNLPVIPTKFLKKPITGRNIQDHLETIKALLSKAEKVVLATDAGREGELIGREILNHFSWSGKIERFWTSEALTPQVISAALNSLRPSSEFDKLFTLAEARQHADWLVGINFSRLVTCLLGNVDTFPVGRVQTAVLAILCQRHQQIAGFVPVSQYALEVTFKTSTNHEFKARLLASRDPLKTLFDKSDQPKTVMHDLSDPFTAAVSSVVTTDVSRNPPKLFSLTALQIEANNFFGFSAQKTLDLAQRLYEEYKILSYPRTPSRVLGESDVNLVSKLFTTLNETYPAVFAQFDQSKIDAANRRVFDNAHLEDHHALLPLAPAPSELPPDEKKIYELVLRSFAAAFSPDSQEFKTQVFLRANQHDFYAQGTVIKSKGWLAIYPQKTEPKDDADEDQQLPDLGEGQQVSGRGIKSGLKETKTKPPKTYNEASILAVMRNPARLYTKETEDENIIPAGLGTEATRAAIIEILISHGYVERKGKALLAKEKGIFLIDYIKKTPLAQIANPEETALWEAALLKDPAGFLENTKGFIIKSVEKVKNDPIHSPVIPTTVGNCPVCSAPILSKKTFWACSNPNCRFTLSMKVKGTEISETSAKILLSGQKTRFLSFKHDSGRTYKAQLSMDRTGKLSFHFEN